MGIKRYGLAVVLVACVAVFVFFGYGLVTSSQHGRPHKAEGGDLATNALIDQAIAELKLTTISGKKWVMQGGPGHWQNAMDLLEQAKGTLEPPPPPPPLVFTVAIVSDGASLTAVRSDGVVATTFQWRRCDSVGNNCNDISGATSSTYIPTSADAGASIRVVADGVTSNPWGIASTTPALYNKDSYNGSTLLTNWPNSSLGSGTVGIVNPDGHGLQLVDDPSGSGQRVVAMCTRNNSTYSGGGTSYQRSDLTDWNHFQHVPVVGQGPIMNGTDWWFSWELYYPSVDVLSDTAVNLGHWVQMAGNWNFHYQLHQDNVIQGGSPAYSQVNMVSGVYSDSPSRANQRLYFRFIGGNLDSASSNAGLVGGGGAYTEYKAPANSLILDHWYRFVMHYKVSNGNDGGAAVWVDGTKVIDMFGASVVSPWGKQMLNSSNALITKTSEQTQPTNFYRINSPNSQGNTNGQGDQYPGVMNYHNYFLTGSTVNTSDVCVLAREWKAGHTQGSVGG